MGDADKPALTAERLTARLRFFPLLIGRVEIADVALERPTITVDIDPNGGSNWSALIEALARSQKPDAQRAAGLLRNAHHRRHRGAARRRAQASARRWTTSSCRSPGRRSPRASAPPATSSGTASRSTRALTLADFAAALAGNRSGIKLRLAGAPIKGAFEGAISLNPTLKIEGTLAADSASLRDALVWARAEAAAGRRLRRISRIKAQTNVMGGTIALTGVNVELDGNTAEGVLTFAADGRKTLQGTLAADTLDLSPYVSTVKLLTANQREWSNGADHARRPHRHGCRPAAVGGATIAVADAKIGRTAIGANLRGGHLVVTIGEAQAYGGVIKGSVALANVDAGVDVKSQLQFTDVDLESCLGQLFGLHRIEGKGNISFTAEGTGDSVLAMTRTLNGTASLTGANGALVGLNVEQLLRRLERRPLSGSGEFRNGRTPFDKLVGDR